MSPILYLEYTLVGTERGVASRELRVLGDTHLAYLSSKNQGVDSELPSLRSCKALVGGDDTVVLLGNHLLGKANCRHQRLATHGPEPCDAAD